MPSPFTITAATNTVLLDANRRGEAAFTVSNISGRPLQGEARLIPGEAQPPILGDLARWLTLVPPAVRPFGIAESVQYRVQIAPPADATPPPATGAPAVNCTFRLDIVGVANPDDDYSQGPTVAFVTPEVKPQEKKKFPWWILVAVGVVIVAAILAFILWPRTVAVPNVRGAAVGDARATLAASGLQVSEALAQGMDPEVETGRVIASTPGAGVEVKRRSEVGLVVANPTPTSVPTVTPTRTSTPTITLTPTPTLNAAATATAQAINKYVGTWVGYDDNPPYMTKVKISRDGLNVRVEVAGNARIIVTGGGALASQVCNTVDRKAECSWGDVITAYTGDPISLRVNSARNLYHQLTISITADRSTLTVVNQVFFNNARSSTTNYLFRRAPRIIFAVDLFKDQPLSPVLLLTPSAPTDLIWRDAVIPAPGLILLPTLTPAP